jgi:tRNA(Ile)-lysidine synthase
MAPRRGRLVRPLLDATAADTRAHCRARGLEWREDTSNSDPRFARARVRHGLLEQLWAIAPTAERTIAETAAQLRDEAAALDAAVAAALERLGGGPAVDAGALAELGPALARLVLRRLAEDACGVPHPLTRDAIDAILTPAAGSRSLDLGGDLRVVSEYGTLRFQLGPTAAAPEPVTLAIPGEARFGRWRIEARAGGGGEVELDAEVLGDSVTVRGWRDGDRLRPLGLGGTKTLQDLFTDRKVPRELRRSLPVLEADGEIAWVAGLAIGERFAPTQATSERVGVSALLT